MIDAHQALCLAELGERQRSLGLARRSRGPASNGLARVIGFLRARVLRTVDGMAHLEELETEIADTLEVLEHNHSTGFLPLLLLERAGVARMKGDAEGMARDLAEARRLFAQMGATGWDDYARSIEA